jgi:hypothetical protein
MFFLAAGMELHAAEQNWKILKAQKPGPSSIIPSEVIGKIKKMAEHKKDGKDLETNFLGAEIFIFDDHGVVDPAVKVVTSAGGGTVDLGALLPEGKAKFSLRMNLKGADGKEVIPDQVFFIPKVSVIKDGKELNCGKYFDVTSYFVNKLMSEKGVETYLTNRIYVSNFVGSFVFVKKDEKELAVGNVNFIDDRFSRWACPQEPSGNHQ